MNPTHPFPFRRWLHVALAAAAGALMAACGEHHEHGHDHDDHSHDPRHGGVAVTLGDEEFHVEFTHGEGPGVLEAYVFDGHMENYIRIAMPEFEATVLSDGRSIPVLFKATENQATGETVGDTALFRTSVPGLLGNPALELEVPMLVVRGATYTNIITELPAAAPSP